MGKSKDDQPSRADRFAEADEGLLGVWQVLQYVPADDQVKGCNRELVLLDIPDDAVIELCILTELSGRHIDPNYMDVLPEAQRRTLSTAGIEDSQAALPVQQVVDELLGVAVSVVFRN